MIERSFRECFMYTKISPIPSFPPSLPPLTFSAFSLFLFSALSFFQCAKDSSCQSRKE